MAITTINQENFDDQVTRSSAPVLSLIHISEPTRP